MKSVEEFMGWPLSEEEQNEYLKRLNEAFEINLDEEKINKMFAMPCDWNLGFEEDKKQENSNQ